MAKYITDVYYDGKIDSNSYLNTLAVMKHLAAKKQLSFSKDVTFLVGENGTGKSTLIEAIAVAYGKLQSGQYAPYGAEKKQEFLRNLGG